MVRKNLPVGRMCIWVLCLFVGLSLVQNVNSAAYIKFDGIDGEAQDKDHKGWVDLLSFKQSIKKPAATEEPTRQRGSAILEDITIIKELDKSSPKLAEALLKGTVIPKVEIHLTTSFTDSGRVTYLSYELKNVLVTSYSISGSGQSEDIPVESFTLNFEEIKVTYTELDNAGKSKGKVEYSWKVEEGEA